MKLIYNIHSQDLNDQLLLKSFDHQPNQYTKRECLFHFGDKIQPNIEDLNAKDILINQPELIYKTITVHRRDGYNAKKKAK